MLFLSVRGFLDYAEPADRSRFYAAHSVAFPSEDLVGVSDQSFSKQDPLHRQKTQSNRLPQEQRQPLQGVFNSIVRIVFLPLRVGATSTPVSRGRSRSRGPLSLASDQNRRHPGFRRNRAAGAMSANVTGLAECSAILTMFWCILAEAAEIFGEPHTFQARKENKWRKLYPFR
jgi:hypothetical protein